MSKPHPLYDPSADPDLAPAPPPAPLVSDAAVATVCHWAAGTVLGLGLFFLVGWLAFVAPQVLGYGLLALAASVFFLSMASSL